MSVIGDQDVSDPSILTLVSCSSVGSPAFALGYGTQSLYDGYSKI